MRDAISGAHIYGKKIIQAESFTTVRMDWSEHPGSLKVVGDRNFALGINKMVMHVFAHNPFPDRKPGVTLDGVGLYFQRDQTWFKQSKAWIEYLTRCQALLQSCCGCGGVYRRRSAKTFGVARSFGKYIARHFWKRKSRSRKETIRK
jgi:hypothetical protein